jgi:hypothetical protein
LRFFLACRAGPQSTVHKMSGRQVGSTIYRCRMGRQAGPMSCRACAFRHAYTSGGCDAEH